MTSPTGSDENHPQGGAPEGPPGYGAPQQPPAGYDPSGYGAAQQPPPGYSPSGYGAPGYGPAPSYAGGPPATGRRPGLVTGAAVVGIVWGALGALFGLLGLFGVSAAEDLGIEISGLDIVLGVIGVAVSIGLLMGGIQTLQGKSPKVLLYAAYAGAALWLVGVLSAVAQGYGFTPGGVVSLLVAGVIIALLLNAQSKQYFASRGVSY